MLTYSIPQLAKEIGTDKENIRLLTEEGFIKAIKFSSKGTKISVFEAERFLIDNAGKDFTEILNELKEKKHLKIVNQQVLEMKNRKTI